MDSSLQMVSLIALSAMQLALINAPGTQQRLEPLSFLSHLLLFRCAACKEIITDPEFVVALGQSWYELVNHAIFHQSS